MTARGNGRGGTAVVSLFGAAVLAGVVVLAVQDRLGINIPGRAEEGAAVVRHALGADPESVGLARAKLPVLPVAPPGPIAGYHRGTAQWGPTWADVDRNGCPTRDDILRRDLTAVTVAGRCTVTAGTLADPYTGRTIQFRKATAGAVQIDHLVPLAEAWRTGAAGWDRARREEFANDPAELLAVDGPANERKGDSGPDTWGPPEEFRCRYAVLYVLVVAKYGLSVSAAGQAALGGMLATCGP